MYSPLAHLAPNFTADMTTYYCHTRAKAAGKRPGCRYGGIVLKSGKKGFAIYREGKVIEQYSVYPSNLKETQIIIAEFFISKIIFIFVSKP